jgi:uncharacterized protein (DUF1330 family)
MAAFLFVAINVHDLGWVESYQAHVPAILRNHGGVIVAASDSIRRYEGVGPDPDRAMLISFPSMAAVEAFISDPEYKPHLVAKRAASSGDVFAFATPD